MKKLFTRILTLAMLMVTLVCAVVPAQAANVCQSISGNMNGAVTFTINTDSRWYTSNKVTLTQTKGQAKCHNIWYNIETKNIYGCYTVTVKDSRGKQVQNKSWTGKTLTISGLKGSSTYTVTVKPASMTKSNIFSEMLCSFYKWNSVPTWKVNRTSGITLCR